MSTNMGGGSGPGRAIAPELGLIGEAWGIFMADIGGWWTLLVPFIVVYVIGLIISGISGGILSIVMLAVIPVMAATFAAFLMRLRTGQNADFNWVKERALQVLVPSLIFGLIGSIAVSCGAALCVIPAFFLMGPFMLGLAQIGEGRSDFMGAFMDNLNLCKENPVPWIIFNLVAPLVSCLIFTIPVTYIAYGLAYRKMYD